MHGQTPPLGGMLIWLWVVEAQNQRNVLLPAWLISRVIIYVAYRRRIVTVTLAWQSLNLQSRVSTYNNKNQ